MGTSYTVKCDICSYSVETSGKVSYGMHYVVCPHVCMDCKIITETIIGMFGQSYPKEELEDPKNYHVQLCFLFVSSQNLQFQFYNQRSNDP